jgi:RHS repeat-associated protein
MGRSTIGPSAWAISSFGPNGNVISMTDSVMGSWTYNYDDLNRVSSATETCSPGAIMTLSWNIDPFGNRSSQSASSNSNSCTASVSQPNFLINGKNQIAAFTYDADGRVIYDGTNHYAYDAEDRVSSVNGTTAYVHNAEGRRVSKGSLNGSAITVTNSYLLGLDGEQVTELTGSGGWVHSNVFADGRLLGTYAGPYDSDPTPGYHFQLTDWLGTRRMEAYATGAPEETCITYPFGDGPPCAGPTEHRFTGKERDAESGNDYFEARYFGSSMGRFLSPDPLGGNLVDPQSLNRYTYVLNNPLRFTDPTGMYVCKDSADCSSKADQKFEKTLAGLRGSKDADVARAAGAYGAANSDNGVKVGFADLSTKGENGNTVSTVGVDANGNLQANSDVTINSKIDGDSYAAAVGHEGSHAADAQDVVASGLSNGDNTIHAGMNITPYQSEVRAWGVTQSILKSGNFTQSFDCGAQTCKLGASPAIGKEGILPSQIPGAIDQILSNSSVYNQGGRPMGPNNQGPSVVNGVTPTPPAASVPH